MIKLESFADVAKGFVGIAGHFKKMAEHHMTAHDHHAAHAAFAKAHHDGLADDHEHKAYFQKAHEHHSAMAALHKAMADHHEAMHAEHSASEKVAKDAPAAKAAAVPAADGKEKQVEKTAGAEDAITAMIDKTVQSVTEKALDTVAKSGKIEEMIEQIVLKRMNERLGAVTVPDNVMGVLPTVPAHLVPRPGQLEGLDKSAGEFPAELAHFGSN
jgi:hypothetical protein